VIINATPQGGIGGMVIGAVASAVSGSRLRKADWVRSGHMGYGLYWRHG
jgi:hypothetical protein